MIRMDTSATRYPCAMPASSGCDVEPSSSSSIKTAPKREPFRDTLRAAVESGRYPTSTRAPPPTPGPPPRRLVPPPHHHLFCLALPRLVRILRNNIRRAFPPLTLGRWASSSLFACGASDVYNPTIAPSQSVQPLSRDAS